MSKRCPYYRDKDCIWPCNFGVRTTAMVRMLNTRLESVKECQMVAYPFEVNQITQCCKRVDREFDFRFTGKSTPAVSVGGSRRTRSS